LTVVLLYSCAILFTSLLGHSSTSGDHPSVTPEGRFLFRTIPEATFTLFRVMTGDTTVMEPALITLQEKLLYVFFLVISKWMILSIFTAVVSENMITGTAKYEHMEALTAAEFEKITQSYRLLTLFKEIDINGDGRLDEAEFDCLLADRGLRQELCEAAHLESRDLQDLFHYLSFQDDDGKWKIRYQDFTRKLQTEGKELRERSVFRLEKQMRLVERRLDSKLQRMRNVLGLADASTPTRLLRTMGRYVLGHNVPSLCVDEDTAAKDK